MPDALREHYAICDRPSPRREALLTALHRAREEFTDACLWATEVGDLGMSGCNQAARRRLNRAHATWLAINDRIIDHDLASTPEAAEARAFHARIMQEERGING